MKGTMREQGLHARKAGIQVPYSEGRDYPKTRIPANACDSHHHIYDPVNYAYQPTDTRNQPPSTVECYQMLQERLGITRSVVVQPSAYGADNRCTLAALEKMGKDRTRAVIVTDDSVSDRELRKMDQMGVRGIRFNICCGGSDNQDMIRRLAERIAPMNWSICFWMSPMLTVSMEKFLRELPCEIVFDHRGHIPASHGISHEGFKVIAQMLRDHAAWVKLSGLYIDSDCDDYADTIEVGRAYVKANPDRVIWGTDWPHPSCYSNRRPMPNDAKMLDDLMLQTETEENFRKALVDNPEKLFGFGR